MSLRARIGPIGAPSAPPKDDPALIEAPRAFEGLSLGRQRYREGLAGEPELTAKQRRDLARLLAQQPRRGSECMTDPYGAPPAPTSGAVAGHDLGPDLGAGVLDGIDAFLARFIAYPNEHARRSPHVVDRAHADFMDVWKYTPRLLFVSPEGGLRQDASRLAG